jgi:HEPN domain-containing protein
MATTITEILGEAGSGLEFEHDGKKYTVCKLKQKIKAQYEQWLHANAIEAAECGIRPALLRWRVAEERVQDIRGRLKNLSGDEDSKGSEDLKSQLEAAERRVLEEEAMLQEARRVMKETKEDIATGQYRFGGPLWIQSARTVAGIIKLSSLLLGGLPEEEVMELFGTASDKLSAAVETSMRQSLPKALTEQAMAQKTATEPSLTEIASA